MRSSRLIKGFLVKGAVTYPAEAPPIIAIAAENFILDEKRKSNWQSDLCY
jgi:hypothetical protein